MDRINLLTCFESVISRCTPPVHIMCLDIFRIFLKFISYFGTDKLNSYGSTWVFLQAPIA